MYTLREVDSQIGKLIQLLDDNGVVIKVSKIEDYLKKTEEELFKKTGDCTVTDMSYVSNCRHAYIEDSGLIVNIKFLNRRTHTTEDRKIVVWTFYRSDKYLRSYFKEYFKKLGLKHVSNLKDLPKMLMNVTEGVTDRKHVTFDQYVYGEVGDIDTWEVKDM